MRKILKMREEYGSYKKLTLIYKLLIVYLQSNLPTLILSRLLVINIEILSHKLE